MPVFVYTARDQAGQQTRGTVEAETDSLAVASLREQGIWVTKIWAKQGGLAQSQTGGGTRDTSFAKRLRSPVSPKELAVFYRQLHTLLHSGVSLYQAVEMLSQPSQCPNPHLRRVVGEIARHVLSGGRFSEPMNRFPWLFDRMQIRLVESGEASGLLSEIFRRLAEYLEREHEIRSEISRKSLYPKLVLGLLVFVWPIRIPLTLNGYLSELSQLLMWIVGLGVTLWFVGRVFLTSQAGRNFYDLVKLSLPGFGKVTRKIITARFARSLAALYGAGVPIASSVALAGETSGSHYLEQQTWRMPTALERGIPLAQCLETTGFFPAMFVGMVSTGQMTGNLDTMLDKAAEYYEEESRHAVNQMVVTLGVVLLLIAAIMVAIKIASFYLGYIGSVMGGADGGGLGSE